MKINSSKVLYTIVFGLFTLYSKSYAACNTCSLTSYAACLNSTAYVMCPDGTTKSGPVRNCAKNTICTDKQGICLPKDSAELGCPSKECNVCSTIMSCVSVKTYAYCDLNGNKMAYGECEDDEVCSIEYFLSPKKSICGKKCDTTPTCSNTEYTTVPTTTASYKESCSGKVATGNYALKDDSSCSRYVFCEIVDNTMVSVLKTCNSYFDPEKQTCVSKKPRSCV